jgi:hypothetical protein|tara:strand:+ start:1026 stop:1157 length:132 start_codon:yes stop_codon:yes gene_type:complete
MPYGMGTYGSKKGRPSKKSKMGAGMGGMKKTAKKKKKTARKKK